MKNIKTRYKDAIVNWLMAYPIITLLLLLLNPMISTWPLPVRTLILTVLMVPIMVFWAQPLSRKHLFKAYLRS